MTKNDISRSVYIWNYIAVSSYIFNQTIDKNYNRCDDFDSLNKSNFESEDNITNNRKLKGGKYQVTTIITYDNNCRVININPHIQVKLNY